MPYAELHCLSNFTFQRGASHPEELVARSHELGYAALAITDECSLAGVVRAYSAAKPEEGETHHGLKLVVGARLVFAWTETGPPSRIRTAVARFPVGR
jgi:error-prone DNA polymerase